MNKARLDKIFAMVMMAGAMGAKGLACGPCPEDRVSIIPVLPPSSDGGVQDAGDYLAEACERLCGANAVACEPTTIDLAGGDTIPAIECTQAVDCSSGRRPEGLNHPLFAQSGATVGGWLARAAFLEAASVDAFRALRRDLARLRAPRRLLRAASRAARDERRHARRMRSLARRCGVDVPRAQVTGRAGVATLEEVAVQNAIEGCVRETFGAVVARWQAGAASDRELGAAMERIAADEARHALLAWQIDAWARCRLDRAARARLDRARDTTAGVLFTQLGRGSPEALVRHLGVPDRAVAQRIARGLAEALGWRFPAPRLPDITVE